MKHLILFTPFDNRLKTDIQKSYGLSENVMAIKNAEIKPLQRTQKQQSSRMTARLNLQDQRKFPCFPSIRLKESLAKFVVSGTFS